MCLLHLFVSWPESAPQWFWAVKLQWPDTGLWIVWLTFMGCFDLCPKSMCFLPKLFKLFYRSELFISTNWYVIKGIWWWWKLIYILQGIHKLFFHTIYSAVVLSSNGRSHIFYFLSQFGDIWVATYLNGLSSFLRNPLSMESAVLNTRYYSKQEETDLCVLIYFAVVLIFNMKWDVWSCAIVTMKKRLTRQHTV